MSAKHRIAALVLSCIVLAVMTFSLFYTACEADHLCPGEDCAVCAVLGLCEALLRELVPPVMLAAALFSACAPSLSQVQSAARFVPGLTPLSLRVRLLD